MRFYGKFVIVGMTFVIVYQTPFRRCFDYLPRKAGSVITLFVEAPPYLFNPPVRVY
jgi:hypothetical protein